MTTYLGYKGYTLYKKQLTLNEQNTIKKDLTIKPYVPKNSMIKVKSFPVFRESQKKIYVPRFYGYENYGNPNEIRIDDGKNIELKFNGTLRDYQKPIVDKFLKHAKKYGCGLLEIHTGGGKTVLALDILSKLQKKTLIIVHKEFLLRQWKERIEEFLPNAKIGRIQGNIIDIENKDIVIGMLQSLSMKEYSQNIFKSFGFTIFDECFPYNQHIHTDNGPIKIGTLYQKWKNNEILPKILSFNRKTKLFEYKKMTYAWRKEREDLIKIKLSKKVINCTPEHKILTTKGYIEANKLNEGDLIICKYDKNHIDNIITPALNNEQLQLVYGSYLGDGNIDITKKNRYRLRVLHCEKQKEYCEWKAKMFNINKLNYIEKNGYSQKPAYYFQTKIFDLEDKIPKNTKYVPDWLIDKIDEKGIAVWYMDDGSIMKRKLKDGTISNYISIHSNNFDYEMHQKFVKKFNEYGIESSIHKSREKYYYLMFNKENTFKLLNLISPYIHSSMKYKIDLKLSSSICNHKWKNEFLNYGLLKVTSINYFKNEGANNCKKPYVYDIEVEDNHNFILGTKRDNKQKNYIDGPVVSNCHHMLAEVFSKALFKIVTKYMLGLSATMERKDGLTKVFKLFIGDIVVKKERPIQDNVTVKSIQYTNNDEKYSETEYNFRGQTHYSRMIKKLCEFKPRRDFILKVLSKILKDNLEQQIMIIGHNKSILIYLHNEIKNNEIASVGYYMGGMKEKDLKESESKKVIIATYAMAEEGLDIKSLSTLLMASPKVDVTQAVGRILRKADGEKLIIDIVDQHPIFERHWKKRKTWYNKRFFTVLRTNNTDFNKDIWTDISKKSVKNKKNTMKKNKNKKKITNKNNYGVKYLLGD